MAQERTENRQVTFNIKAHLGVLATKKDGWSKELNLVSWNGAQPAKFDIREWSEDHKSMKKGVTLYASEMNKLCQFFQDYNNARIVSESKYRRNAAAEAGIRAGVEERTREEEPEHYAKPEQTERPEGGEQAEAAAVQEDHAAEQADTSGAEAENDRNGGIEAADDATPF